MAVRIAAIFSRVRRSRFGFVYLGTQTVASLPLGGGINSGAFEVLMGTSPT